MRPRAIREAAIDLAARGFPVFPLHDTARGACSCDLGAKCDRPAKHPRVSGGYAAATTNEGKIRAWWSRSPTANVAISTGGPMRLVVIDVDGFEGQGQMDALETLYSILPATLTVRTGRGVHYYLRCPESFGPVPRINAGKIAPKVDHRGDGGYVVAPPSVHASGAVYAFENPAAEIADLPRWLYDLMTAEKERPADKASPASTEEARREATARGPLDSPGRPDAVTRALAWLSKCEASIAGQGGHDKALFAACGVVRGFDLSNADAFMVLGGEWNRRCVPPWSEKELLHKIGEARENGRTFAFGELLHAERPRPAMPAPLPYSPSRPTARLERARDAHQEADERPLEGPALEDLQNGPRAGAEHQGDTSVSRAHDEPRELARAPEMGDAGELDAARPPARVGELAREADEHQGGPAAVDAFEDDRKEREAIQSEPQESLSPLERRVLAAVRDAAPQSIRRPEGLLETLPDVPHEAALDNAASLLDRGELATDGGALVLASPGAPRGPGESFGEGTRAVLRAITSAKKNERDAAAGSRDVLLFAAFFRPDTDRWGRLYQAIRGFGVRVREWARAVDALRPAVKHDADAPAGEDARAVVMFNPSRPDDAIAESIGHLRGAPNLYQRAGRLTTIVAVTPGDMKRYPFLVKEAPFIAEVSAPTLVEWLCPRVRFETWSGERTRVIAPPKPVLAAIHLRAHYPGIPPLTGIIETPTIRPLSDGGGVVSTPGYEERIGYFYKPPHGVVFPAVADSPSREDAREALGSLLDVFVDFPFETESGRSVAVAAVLTLIARPAIAGCTPIFLFDATTQASGKSLAVNVIHKIATGRIAGKVTLPVDRRGVDEAELRKVLASVAQSAAASVTLDNIEPPAVLGGSALAHAVTTGVFEGRRMGTDKTFRTAWETVLFATGNNVSVTPDLYRRTLLARQTSPFEKPQFRPLDSYIHPERAGEDRLFAWLDTERPRLVAAALTLLRAFIVAGAPRCAVRAGSFEAWCDLVASAIVWAGGADPGLCFMGSDDTNERPDEAALRIVLRDLPRIDERGRGVTVKEALALLYPPERIRGGQLPPDGFDDLRGALEELAPPSKVNAPPDARGLGLQLRNLRGKIVDGAKLEQGQTAHSGLKRWVVVAAGPKPTNTAPSGDSKLGERP